MGFKSRTCPVHPTPKTTTRSISLDSLGLRREEKHDQRRPKWKVHSHMSASLMTSHSEDQVISSIRIREPLLKDPAQHDVPNATKLGKSRPISSASQSIKGTDDAWTSNGRPDLSHFTRQEPSVEVLHMASPLAWRGAKIQWRYHATAMSI